MQTSSPRQMAQNMVALSIQDVKRMESYIQLELALLLMQKSEAMNELQVAYMSGYSQGNHTSKAWQSLP